MKQSAPGQAIERLAAELMNLSNDEWAQATERMRAGLGWDAVFGPAWDEISERLSDIDWRALAVIEADEAQDGVTPSGETEAHRREKESA